MARAKTYKEVHERSLHTRLRMRNRARDRLRALGISIPTIPVNVLRMALEFRENEERLTNLIEWLEGAYGKDEIAEMLLRAEAEGEE